MHRIVPAVALAGSSIPAFDDINIADPDFEYIQGKIDKRHFCFWFSSFLEVL